MEALQMFYYATVGLAALIFVIGNAKMSIKDASARLARRKARVLSKRFHEAFESVQPTVELWWEDQGRQQMRFDKSMFEVLPEQLRTIAETQHCNSIKQMAAQLAGGLVLQSDAKLSTTELSVIDKEIEELRQQLLNHGIDTDNFEKLFV